MCLLSLIRLVVLVGFKHVDLSADTKSLKFPSKVQARIGPKSVSIVHRFLKIGEVVALTRDFLEFSWSVDKIGVCKSVFSRSSASKLIYSVLLEILYLALGE